MPKGKPRTTGATVDNDGSGNLTYWSRQLERGERGAKPTTRGGARVAVGDRRLADAEKISRRDSRDVDAVVTRNVGKKGKGRR
jgi:hypothetical protein